MNKASYILLIAAAAFVSCRSSRPAPLPQVIIKDSVVERTTIEYRDTVIYRPGEKIKISVPCPDAPVKDTQVRKGNTALTIERRDNSLHITCETDSLRLVIDSLKSELREKQSYSQKVIVQTVTEQVFVNRIPKWVWYLVTINVLYLLWRFRNPIVSLVKRIG